MKSFKFIPFLFCFSHTMVSVVPLLLVLCTSSLVQGYDYFVLKPGSREGICVSNETSHTKKDVFPMFDLESNNKPQRGWVGWAKDWEHTQTIHDLGAYEATAYRNVLMNGSDRFEKLGSFESEWWYPFYLLGSNVTVLLTHAENWTGKDGFKIEIQQTDKLARRSVLKQCHELGTAQEHCETLKTKNEAGSSLASDKWVVMILWWTEHKNSELKYEFTTNYKKLFGFNTARKSSLKPNYIFVKSNQGPVLFRVPIGSETDVVQPNWFRRNFTIGEDRSLCVFITGGSVMGVRGHYALSDANSGKVVNEGGLEFNSLQSKLSFVVPSSGVYKLELTNVTVNIMSINICVGDLKIFSEKGKVVGCTIFNIGQLASVTSIVDLEVADSAPASDIAQNDVEKICDAMGASEKKETVKFCGERGCFLNKCG